MSGCGSFGRSLSFACQSLPEQAATHALARGVVVRPGYAVGGADLLRGPPLGKAVDDLQRERIVREQPPDGIELLQRHQCALGIWGWVEQLQIAQLISRGPEAHRLAAAGLLPPATHVI